MRFKQCFQIIILLFAAVFPHMAAAVADKGISTILDNGYIRVGVTGNLPPYVMHSAIGELMGLDIDLARSMASAMNVGVKFLEMPFDQLLTALDQNKIDLVMSGMDITLARSNRALFAGPYSMSGKSILTKQVNLEQFNKINTMNKAHVRVVALGGSTSVEFVNIAMPQVKLIKVKDLSEGVEMVKAGDVDFMVADMAICSLNVILNPEANLATMVRPLSLQPVGIAINAEHPALHNLISNYLHSYEALGMLDKLRATWFENDDWVNLLPDKKIVF